MRTGPGRSREPEEAESFPAEEIRKVLSSSRARAREVAKLEETIRCQGGPVSQDYFRKAGELAEFMVSGKIDPSNKNFLRNAKAIARLLGEKEAKRIARQGLATPELVLAIDELTTLYALGKLDEETKATVTRLAGASS